MFAQAGCVYLSSFSSPSKPHELKVSLQGTERWTASRLRRCFLSNFNKTESARKWLSDRSAMTHTCARRRARAVTKGTTGEPKSDWPRQIIIRNHVEAAIRNCYVFIKGEPGGFRYGRRKCRQTRVMNLWGGLIRIGRTGFVFFSGNLHNTCWQQDTRGGNESDRRFSPGHIIAQITVTVTTLRPICWSIPRTLDARVMEAFSSITWLKPGFHWKYCLKSRLHCLQCS